MVETESPYNASGDEPSLHARVVILPHEPVKTSTYVLAKVRLLPPPIPLSVIDTAVAVDEVAKRNHRSYVVAVVGAGVPQDPAAPSLKAFLILYVTETQLEEGVIVVATAPQVSDPGVCENDIAGIKIKMTTKKKIRTGDKNLMV